MQTYSLTFNDKSYALDLIQIKITESLRPKAVGIFFCDTMKPYEKNSVLGGVASIHIEDFYFYSGEIHTSNCQFVVMEAWREFGKPGLFLKGVVARIDNTLGPAKYFEELLSDINPKIKYADDDKVQFSDILSQERSEFYRAFEKNCPNEKFAEDKLMDDLQRLTNGEQIWNDDLRS